MIIANVSPSAICSSETIGTLSFALRAKSMRNNAKINVDTQVGRCCGWCGCCCGCC
jgi:kinesin family protein 15